MTIGQLLAGMALFGNSTPISKIFGESYSVFTASCMVVTIASVVLVPFVVFAADRFMHANRFDIFVFAAISCFGILGFTATMLFGMRLTTGVIGSTIMSASPAITALGAVISFSAAMN